VAGMSRWYAARILPVLLVLGVSAVGQVSAHSASRGLHLHLDPNPAKRGQKITVRIDAVDPIVHLKVSFVGGSVQELKLKTPKKSVKVRLRVPKRIDGHTVNCQAEAVTVKGETVRSSAILRLQDRPGRLAGSVGQDLEQVPDLLIHQSGVLHGLTDLES
jgi:hypothetical protein